MKKKAIFALCAAVCAATAILSGCGEKSSGSILILDGKTGGTSVSVTTFGNRADRYSFSVIENTLQKFMSENAVIATYESATEKSYFEALERRYKTDNLDDIFTPRHDILTDMVAKDKLCDLTGLVDADSFNDLVRSQLYIDGSIYAVPTSISTYGLYVNHDLLREHGQSIPSKVKEFTLDKFTAVCNYFKGQGITPVICNNYSSLSSLILAIGMADTYSGSDTENEIAKFNADPATLAEPLSRGIDFVYGMKANGWIDLDKTALTEQGTTDLELFATGEYPFMITGAWEADTLKEMTGAGTLDYRIYPYPVLDNGSVLVAKTDMLSVKKGKNEKEAKKLLSLLMQSETLISLNYRQSRFSPLKDGMWTDASGEIIQSATHLKEGQIVICGDMRLTVPLESYLSVCSDLILQNKSAEEVKNALSSLLRGTGNE